MKLTRQLAFLALSAGLLYSCGNKEAESAEHEAPVAEVKDTTSKEVADTTKFKFDFAVANIPSPAASMQEVQSWNVAYDNAILNPTQNASKYVTEFQKSLNLGVYNIDMAYAMMNNKGPDVLSNMKTAMQLSDALGLKNAVNTLVGKRAEANLNSKDSLFAILDEIFIKSDNYLRTNERVYTASTIFAGSWIENLYLSSTLAGQLTDEKAKATARKHLWEQRFHLGNIINLLNDYKTKKECAELMAGLSPIHAEILAIKDPSEMTAENFSSISAKIIALRTKIIS